MRVALINEPCEEHIYMYPNTWNKYGVHIYIDAPSNERHISLYTPQLNILTLINGRIVINRHTFTTQLVHLERGQNELLSIFYFIKNSRFASLKDPDILPTSIYTDLIISELSMGIPPYIIETEALNEYIKTYDSGVHSIYMKVESVYPIRYIGIYAVFYQILTKGCAECNLELDSTFSIDLYIRIYESSELDRNEETSIQDSGDISNRHIYNRHISNRRILNKFYLESLVSTRPEVGTNWINREACIDAHNELSAPTEGLTDSSLLIWEKYIFKSIDRHCQYLISNFEINKEEKFIIEEICARDLKNNERRTELRSSMMLSNVIRSITPQNSTLHSNIRDLIARSFHDAHQISLSTDRENYLLCIDGIPIPDSRYNIVVKTTSQTFGGESIAVLQPLSTSLEDVDTRKRYLVDLKSRLYHYSKLTMQQTEWKVQLPVSLYIAGLRQCCSLIDKLVYYTNCSNDIDIIYSPPYTSYSITDRSKLIITRDEKITVASPMFVPSAIVKATPPHDLDTRKRFSRLATMHIWEEKDIPMALEYIQRTSYWLAVLNGVSVNFRSNILSNLLAVLLYHPLMDGHN